MLVAIVEVKPVSRKQMQINELESRINDLNKKIVHLSTANNSLVMYILQEYINRKIVLLNQLEHLKYF